MVKQKRISKSVKKYLSSTSGLHKLNYAVIGLLLGLIAGYFMFHRESAIDQKLRDIASVTYPDDKTKQRQAVADFRESLDELYAFSQNGGVEQARKDTLNAEVKADINAIHARLEMLYSQNGWYPGQITQTSLDGIAYENLVDREGGLISSEYSIENIEPVNIFGGYAPNARYRFAGYNCEEQLDTVVCQHYVLFGWLEGGTVYTKKSLN